MQLIRVENIDGNGMLRNRLNQYSDIKVVEEILPELNERHRKFPLPYYDGETLGNNFISGTHYCGYKSIEQIQEWIYPNEFKVLSDNNYKVFLYEVNIFLEGKHQVVFKKSDVLSKTDITNLFIK